MPSATEIIQGYLARHGGLKGNAYPIDPQVETQTTDVQGRPITTKATNTDPTYHYEFEDGTVLEMNGQGQIKNSTEVPAPKAPAGWTDVQAVRNSDGSSTYYGKGPDGMFDKVPGLPNSAAPASADRADPALQLQKQSDGSYAVFDPKTGKVTPTGTSDPGAAAAYQAQMAASRASLASSNASSAATALRVQLDKAQAARDAELDPIRKQQLQLQVEALQRVAAGTPKEGDERPNTDSRGNPLTEIWRGGSWVTNTNKPFGAPQTVTAPATQEFIGQQPAGGGPIDWLPNQNYAPTDVAGQVRQLQAQAKAERDRINAQPGKSESEKLAEFDTWWQTNVVPRKQQIDQAQQTAQSALQRQAQQDQRQGLADETTYERNRQSDARQAGRDAVADSNATLPYRVGPQFGEHFAAGLKTLSSGGGPVNFSAGDFMFDLPDTAAIAEQATARALAGISPYAAMKASQPMPTVPPLVDTTAALNPGRYQFGGPTTTVAPDGTVTVSHSAQPDPVDPMIGNDRRHAGTPVTAPTAPSAMNQLIRGY